MFKTYLEKVINKIDLTEEEMKEIMEMIMEGQIDDINVGAFLVALRAKGETVAEITGAAKIMRSKVSKVEIDTIDTLDTCGTGGDSSGTFNISTTTAFVCAANEVKVVKHGNRSVSSKSGSADVLENLGVKIDLLPHEVKTVIEDECFGFFFAPVYHSAMKHVMPARKSLGVRTIFNILGPLTNPAFAENQLLGVFDESLTETLAEVLKNLGVKRAMVVHGLDGLDEITITDKTKVSELKNGEINTYILNPEDYGIKIVDNSELLGGDTPVNAEILLEVLAGEKGPKRDIVALNAGAGLYLAGKADTLENGIKLANETLDSQKAFDKLNRIIEKTSDIYDIR